MVKCPKCQKPGHQKDQGGAGMGQHRLVFIHDNGPEPCLLNTVWPVPKIPPLSQQGNMVVDPKVNRKKKKKK
jgi:hypothetical protein